jgi:hypothetical protein
MEASTIPVGSWHEFFTAYEAAHQNTTNRWIHHVTHLAVAGGFGALVAGHLWGIVPIVASLPVNWLAHLVFEGNRPAFFAPADAWGKAQVALGGLVWTATTLAPDVRRLRASR